MKTITEIISEGYGNSEPFGDISRDGQFIDYFGDTIEVGNTVVFISQDFRDSKDFYKATVKSLITDKGGTDYCVIDNVQAPSHMSKVKNGAKKRCDLCVIVGK